MSNEDLARGIRFYHYDVIESVNSLSLLEFDYLYHYTTLQGCLGILESKSLWASDARCLNDTLELAYGIDLICDELLKQHVESKERSRLELEVRNLRSHPRNVYIASFSTERDQLGQWSAYAGNSGLNIGLRFGKLATQFRKNHAVMGPVVYDLEHQKKLVSDLIAELLRRYRSTGDGGVGEQWLSIAVNFSVNAMTLAAYMKHPKFAEEKEWRVASYFAVQSELKFRASSSMIIPYLPIEIDFTTDRCAQLRITVGPMPHAALVKDIVVGMLKTAHLGVDKLDVRSSDIPYRNW